MGTNGTPPTFLRGDRTPSEPGRRPWAVYAMPTGMAGWTGTRIGGSFANEAAALDLLHAFEHIDGLDAWLTYEGRPVDYPADPPF